MPNEYERELRDAIARRRALVIAGAGVSIMATANAPTASWEGLIRHGAKKLADLRGAPDPDLTDAIEANLKLGADGCIAAADLVETRMLEHGDGEYSGWLREAVGGLQASPGGGEVLGALRGLGCSLGTTNYDDLLSDSGRGPVTWRQQDRFLRVMRGADGGILHFHGHWQTPESVVLGSRRYSELIGSELVQTLQRAIAALDTLVFVGCGDGLEDPNFGRLIGWMSRCLHGTSHHHFRLHRTREVASLQRKHTLDGVRVIGYGNEYDDLVPFLRSLAPTRTLVPASGAATSSLAVPPPDGRRHTIPSKPLKLHGRDAETAALVAALSGSSFAPRIVMGGPGMGKTALALTALHDPAVLGRFGARRYFVDLSEAQTVGDALVRTAGSCGVALGDQLEARLVLELDSAPALLVLDNLESPWEAPDQTEPTESLLSRLGNLANCLLCATIRGTARPLGPAWEEPLHIGPLSEAASQSLFLSVAGANCAAAARFPELVRAMDGVPLALRLVAQRSQSDPTLESVWEAWKRDRTGLLKRGAGKSQNLQASLALSVDGPRMDEPARMMAALLASYPRPLLRPRLRATIKDADTRVLRLLETGLAELNGDAVRLLSPIHEYLRKELRPMQRELHVLDTDLCYAAKLWEERLGKPVAGAAAVTEFMLEGESAEAAIDRLLRAVGAEHRQLGLESAHALASVTAWTRGAATRTLDAAIKIASTMRDRRMHAALLRRRGETHIRRSELGEAEADVGSAMAKFKAAGAPLGEADCLWSLAEIRRQRSELDEAREGFEAAMAKFKAAGEPLGEANCLQSLAEIRLQRSELDEARQGFEAAMAKFKAAGEPLGEADCLRSLAEIRRQRSELDEAREGFEAAMASFKAAGEPLGEANALQGICEVEIERRALDAAERTLNRIRLLRRQAHDFEGVARSNLLEGRIAQLRGEHEVARTSWISALREFERIGMPFEVAETKLRLASLRGPDRDELRQTALAFLSSIGREDLDRLSEPPTPSP